MSDALPLPPRPNTEQYKKLAKECQRAWKSPDPAAFRDWASGWVQTLVRLQGRPRTPESEAEIQADIARLERQLSRMQKSKAGTAPRTLADAQLFVARCHGFASWPRFVKHLEALARVNSPASKFEDAADAIVSGDVASLDRLLTENPGLVRARSARDHYSTLLHYVSANGVEDFRQKTPKNIVQITKLLLGAGADVNAQSDAYGGHSTTLGLTATSCHPDKAGVQLSLMELLIGHGATIDGPDGASAVNACLHNGRTEASRFLAGRGAHLDLEGAAGVGRLDIVRSFFRDDGSLKPPATEEQLKNAFAWACEFGRTDVADFLLHKGIDVAASLRHHGQTGLHWAAFGGHVDTVRLLLERGASVNSKDLTFGGTPLEWAIYAWGKNAEDAAHTGDHYEVVRALVRAGAVTDPAWFADDEERKRAARRMQSDPRMVAALRGRLPSG
jgi:ankyrin repeat protein